MFVDNKQLRNQSGCDESLFCASEECEHDFQFTFKKLANTKMAEVLIYT